MIIELGIILIVVGTSFSEYGAEVIKIIRESGLKYEPHSVRANI